MTYRESMPRLALVMLALTAAYGVYEFQLVFVPWWIALASATAFELVYVALAVLSTPDRRRAAAIAFTAVGVSVVYNSLAALFTRRPELLNAPPLWADVALATLHGAPLAIVAYNLSVLLVHQRTPAEHERSALEGVTIGVGRHTFTVEEWAQITGLSTGTLYRRVDRHRAQLEAPTDADQASKA
jgi:hypothetical protein